MRYISLLLILSGCSVLLQAQRSKVISVFQLIETAKYDDAKKAIEEALTDKKTMEWPKTWYARGLLCQVAYEKKKTKLYPDQLYVAYESYEKALALDTRGRLETQLAPLYVRLANEFQMIGERHYTGRKYDDALKAFEQALLINRSPILSVLIDTSLVYNTALAASEAKQWDKAIGYLSILHKEKYSSNASHLLFNVFLEKGDTASAEKVLLEGIDRYEDHEDMVLLLVDLLFHTNNIEKAVAILDSAAAGSPSKYIFPYTKSLVYQKTSQYRKAIDAYEEAINLAPKELKIYSNIGTCYYNIGVEIDENARTITNNRIFLEERAKSISAFESAVEWLEKAHEMAPENQQVIMKLYQLYNALLITDKINKMKEKISW
ncbi:MAG: tetratricopeptide repeat protein [Bacteroidales bacterium]